MMKLGKIALIGALTFGGFTAVEMIMPTKQASAATLDNFTVVSSANSYYRGQSFLLKATNENDYDVRYRVTVEKLYKDGWKYYDVDFQYQSLLPAHTYEDFDVWTGDGGAISEVGTYRLKIEITHEGGKTGMFYTAPIKLKLR